jgi:hypothetical protein
MTPKSCPAVNFLSFCRRSNQQKARYLRSDNYNAHKPDFGRDFYFLAQLVIIRLPIHYPGEKHNNSKQPIPALQFAAEGR